MRIPWALAAVGLVLPALGCDEPVIRRYGVSEPVRIEQRTLAAIVPHGPKTWFLKLSGPADVVVAHAKEFETLVRSLRLVEDEERPLSWDLPQNWTEHRGSGLRYATLQIGPEEQALEVSVTALGEEAGSLLANVNRWRGQIGLHTIAEGDLAGLTYTIDLAGIKATLIDMTGPGQGASPVAAPVLPVAKAEGPRLSYSVSPGWVEEATVPGDLRVASFSVSEGEQRAVVTVTPLAGPVRLGPNIDRWRGQIGLAPLASEEEAAKAAQPLDLGWATGHIVDLASANAGQGEAQRMLVVMAEREGQTWFFKMLGPPELVGRQKATLEDFVRSVRFEEVRPASEKGRSQ